MCQDRIDDRDQTDIGVTRLLSTHNTIKNIVTRLVMKTPEQGGDTIVHAVLDTDLTQACHLENHRPVRVSSWADDGDNQEKLWRGTCDLLNIDTFGQQ